MDLIDLQHRLEAVICLLECYLPLANAHANDFLIENSWHSFLPSFISADIELLVNTEDDPLTIVRQFFSARDSLTENPLDAESVRKDIVTRRNSVLLTSSLPNMVSPPPERQFNKLAPPLWIHHSLQEFITACAACSLTAVGVVESAPVAPLNSFVSHGMSVKKSHEVEVMSASALALLPPSPSLLVDIGSGKGYLGTYLHLSHGVQVLEVDALPSNSQGAELRRQKMRPRWKSIVYKERSRQGVERPEEEGQTVVEQCSSVNGCRTVTAMISDGKQLHDLIIGELELDDQSSVNLLVCGLHTCGHLASTLLHTFVQCPIAKSLLNVGCCYHLLEERHYFNPHLDKLELSGVHFPMSCWLTARAEEHRFALGRNSRVLASQSLERLAAGTAELHESMWHRVLLQRYLLETIGHVSDDWIVGKIGRKCRPGDALDYFKRALDRLEFTQLSSTVTVEEVEELDQRFQIYRRRLMHFFLLRCCLAPAVEACLLLDRLLYLRESDLNSARLVQLFQPEKSPRCFAFIATKY